MANTLIKIAPPPPPPPPPGGGGGGGGGTVSPTCSAAVQRKVFELFGPKGYFPTAVQGSNPPRWVLDNPIDPYIWYVTGTCSGGNVTLSITNRLRVPWPGTS